MTIAAMTKCLISFRGDWDWSLFVKPAAGFENLAINRGGLQNNNGIIECEIEPPDGFWDRRTMHCFLFIPCERCGTVAAMLIFAPNATDPGHFEGYAHKMYPHYNHLNVPTWIIGP